MPSHQLKYPSYRILIATLLLVTSAIIFLIRLRQQPTLVKASWTPTGLTRATSTATTLHFPLQSSLSNNSTSLDYYYISPIPKQLPNLQSLLSI